jgi:anti-sigma factor RsiW
MAVDSTRNDDLQRLNALIDGELPPAEHAALAARIAAGRDLAHAHATLARLKACVVDGANQGPAPQVARSRMSPCKRPAGLAAAAAAAAVLVLGIVAEYRERVPESHPQRGTTAIVLAALPASPVIPDLAEAGLVLVGTEVETVAETPLLLAAYRGPRGCRLELRVHAAAATVPPTRGTSRRAWAAGDLGYELVAFGMPAERFAAVADAAQAATRATRPLEPTVTRMRQARRSAAPCVG